MEMEMRVEPLCVLAYTVRRREWMQPCLHKSLHPHRSFLGSRFILRPVSNPPPCLRRHSRFQPEFFYCH